MMRKFINAFFIICLFPAVLYAFDYTGLQPISPYGVFSTFSAESLPKYKVAAELGLERTKNVDFYRYGIKGAYGLTDFIELEFMAPYVNQHLNAIEGPEDFSLGVKHRFFDEGKYGPSLAYVLNASINNGRDEFSTNGRVGFGFIASKRVGPFKGHFNFFFEKPGTRTLQNEVTFSGGIDLSASNNFNLLGELIVKKGYNTNQYDHVETRFGYRIKTADFLYTTIGLGVNLKNRSPEYRFILEVSVASANEKMEVKRIYEEE